MSAHTLNTIAERVSALAQRLALCHGKQQALQEQLHAVSASVAEAKGRAALHQEVQAVFEALQLRAHERSVGAFERLLTRLLNDVLPGEGRVKLSLGLRNNAPALDILQEKNGALEDIFDANGGAVTNVISAGLRYIALSRTANRKLMVLDEADCWVKPDRVTAFVKVLSDVADATKTQTFLISHHDIQLFEGYVNVVELHTRSDGVRTATLRHAQADWQDSDSPGVRAIELHNFRMHKSLAIPCPPGLTAFIGENNYGKSTAIATALRAVAYNQSDDSLISHGESEARVVLHLERGRRLEWSRKPSRNPVVQYALYEGDSEAAVLSGKPASRGEAPAWVREILGINKVDDLDIQIHHQKKPVFLLDEPASRRAQILSVGREAGHLRQLMAEYEAVRGEDRATIKQGEASASQLTQALQATAGLGALVESFSQFQGQFKASVASLARVDSLASVLTRLTGLHARAQVLEQVNAVAAVPALPDWSALDKLHEVLSRMGRVTRTSRLLESIPAAVRPLAPAVEDESLLQATTALARCKTRIALLSAVPELQAAPELPDTGPLNKMGHALARAKARLSLLDKVPEALPPPPDIEFNASLLMRVTQMEETHVKLNQVNATCQQAAEELAALQREEQELITEAGGLCPICGSHLEHQHA